MLTRKQNKHGDTIPHSSVLNAFRRADIFAQFGFVAESIEDLLDSNKAKRSEYLPWRVVRIQYPRFMRSSFVQPLFSHTANRITAGVKLGASITLLVSKPRQRLAKIARVVQATTQIYQNTRAAGLGQDGADQGLVVQQAGQLVASFSKPGSKMERSASLFISGQCILSYFTSGYVKLISPVWRSGDAMIGITRTVSYGGVEFNNLMVRYPAIRKAIAWSVIIGEVSAPVMVFLPTPIRRIWQISMVTMHISIAIVMGLNRFMWAFASFHPILDETVRQFLYKPSTLPMLESWAKFRRLK
ncbi:hypothetical protein [Yaniella flava]|uniref:hypothetical protein n=1 Tax=Yaniella flava TaxID=287930 RepID=UPI0031E26622